MEDHLKKIDKVTCPSCSNQNEEENRFCVHCGNPILKKGKTLAKRHRILFGLIGLILIGSITFFAIGALDPRLVGRVNGEGISRKEFSRRLERAKRFYELKYGKGLFEGEKGKENLNLLKSDILDEMVVEKILLQEAKKAGFVSAPQEEIERNLNLLMKKSNLSENDFKQKMDLTIEEVKENLQKVWIINQFIEKSILKGDQKNGEATFINWLSNIKAKANIETYEKFVPAYTGKAPCCSTGCGGGRAQPLDPKIEQEAKAKALEYYEKKTQKRGAEAKVTNFGCHIQVDVIENGKVVLSLTYNGREVQEI